MPLEPFFVVYNQGTNTGPEERERKSLKGKTLGPVEQANFIKLEAESVKEAQEIVENLFPASTQTPVVVKEAAWKTS